MSLIVMDKKGNLAVGVSTSGAANKHPGRVGDSPLPGSGLYVDNKVGAAAATGDGDDIMKFCCSFQIVQYLKQGLDVQSACDKIIDDIAERIGAENMFEVAVIAMDTKGRYGAAGTVKSFTDDKTSIQYPGFPYAVWHQETEPLPKILVQPPKDLLPKDTRIT
ncbi:N(4)-(Beta-N-acetylglucosaminyl)-L-asparaginase-like [Ptychodera flava]|uniref:N(4)-(Beta-N-acetylglucosaminyl)-L-asparaginase- like n=1 Tax=Ptychodera flava TaxID=63121 RepID=UPI00396A7EFE